MLILDGWSRTDESGIGLARQGIDNLKAAGSFARMPYWLSLLADLSARGTSGPTPRARPSTPRSSPPAPTTICGGCPR